MSTNSLWQLSTEWANAAAVCFHTALGKEKGLDLPPPPIRFHFIEIPSNKAGQHLCECSVSFPCISVSPAESRSLPDVDCELRRLICQTLNEMHTLNMKTKVTALSQGNSFTINFESVINSEGNLEFLSWNERPSSPSQELGGVGMMRFSMVLPCDAKRLEAEGESFFQYLGVLQREFGVRFVVENTVGDLGTKTLEIPGDFIVGNDCTKDKRFSVQCSAYLRSKEKESQTIIVNCVPRAKFSLLEQEIRHFCPEEAWTTAIQGFTEVKRILSPSIASKNILLLFLVRENDPFPALSSPLSTDEALKVDLHPSFYVTMEECAHNAMMNLLGDALLEKEQEDLPMGKVAANEFERLHIPSMAGAISAIFSRSNNEQFREEAFSLLGLDTVDDLCPRIQRLLMEMYLGLHVPPAA